MDHVNYTTVLLDFNVLSYYYIRTQVQSQADNQSETYLADDFKFAMKSFLVFPKNLDIVIPKSLKFRANRVVTSINII